MKTAQIEHYNSFLSNAGLIDLFDFSGQFYGNFYPKTALRKPKTIVHGLGGSAEVLFQTQRNNKTDWIALGTSLLHQILSGQFKGAGAIKGGAQILSKALANTKFAGYASALSAIISFVPNEVYEKTVVQFFKDKRIDCWGSSWSPSKAKTALETDIPTLQEAAAAITAADPEFYGDAVNQWIDFFYSVQAHGRTWLRYNPDSSPRDCTKDGLELLINALDDTKTRLMKEMKKVALQKGGKLVVSHTEFVEYPVQNGLNLKHPKVERYKMVLNKTASLVASSELTKQVKKATPKSTTIILAAALAAGALLFVVD
jgi:hypothetical protein